MTQPPTAPRTVEIQSLSRDCHEALILAILASGARHGYQLALALEERSGGAFRLRHGTLYPILHKLEQQGLIRGGWLDESTRRKRKSYALTEAGRERLAAQTDAWRGFFDRLFSILEEVEP